MLEYKQRENIPKYKGEKKYKKKYKKKQIKSMKKNIFQNTFFMNYVHFAVYLPTN